MSQQPRVSPGFEPEHVERYAREWAADQRERESWKDGDESTYRFRARTLEGLLAALQEQTEARKRAERALGKLSMAMGNPAVEFAEEGIEGALVDLAVKWLERAERDAAATTESLCRCGYARDDADARAKRLNDALTAAEARAETLERERDGWEKAALDYPALAVRFQAAQAQAALLREALEHARQRLKEVMDYGVDDDRALAVVARLHDEWTLIGRALASGAGENHTEDR